MAIIPVTISHIGNPAATPGSAYPADLLEIASLEKAAEVFSEISAWPGYSATPLHRLDSLASTLGIDKIWYKDESQRFHLKSFKALGGAYAVAKQLQQQILVQNGVVADIDDLLSGAYSETVKQVVISCATDGNHGRSVAWGCQMFGCECVIYIHRDVTAGREQAMQELGAKVLRIDGNYDDSVKQADQDAKKYSRVIVSDTSYPGYDEIPRDVALGYTVMLAEAVQQMQPLKPTHVFIQAGVGGLAASVCAYFWELWSLERPRFIVVEPEQANCLQQSAQAGQPVVVQGDLETLMAGLSCGEVSMLAWQVLNHGADDFITISEDAVAPCMRLLAKGTPTVDGIDGTPTIEAGESAVAGLAALIGVIDDSDFADKLELNADSCVFVIGTEGATDPDLYRELIQEPAA